MCHLKTIKEKPGTKGQTRYLIVISIDRTSSAARDLRFWVLSNLRMSGVPNMHVGEAAVLSYRLHCVKMVN